MELIFQAAPQAGQPFQFQFEVKAGLGIDFLRAVAVLPGHHPHRPAAVFVFQSGQGFQIAAEIERLIGKVEQKGYTLVPINLHWKGGKIKCEIALAKGKAEHDKRDTIKDREGKREVERAMKVHHR